LAQHSLLKKPVNFVRLALLLKDELRVVESNDIIIILQKNI